MLQFYDQLFIVTLKQVQDNWPRCVILKRVQDDEMCIMASSGQ